jgi:predicted HAD superfamily Cof-like phosphohydrolase
MGQTGDLVRPYHEKMHPEHLGYRPSTVPADLMKFRRRLDHEESAEVVEAWDAYEANPGNHQAELAHLLHELADRTIVAYGTAQAVGVDLDDVIVAVMRANMRKVPPTVPGGKATKPAGWVPADEVIHELVRRAELGRETVKLSALPFVNPSAAARSAVRSDQTLGPVFTARFDSECDPCGGELCEGDEARMFEGEAMHRRCAEQEAGLDEAT